MDRLRILNLNNQKDRILFSKLKKKAVIVDEINEQIKELGLVKNPELLLISEADRHRKLADKLAMSKTLWIYYPWRDTLVHCLNKNDFKLLRTSRNRNLITKEEQDKFENITIGVAGLNVGNPGAVCMALEADVPMKLADIDALSVSNLNRFRAGLCDLGINKAVLSARQIYEINPFAKLEVFENGITPENIEKFLLKPRVSVLIEEMDNILLKIKIREMARENKIPVVMVTGNGENIIIDVERYDLNPKLPLLNGYLKKDVIDRIKAGPKTFKERIKLMQDFMGAKYLHPRLVKSFLLVGSEIPAIPQLAESSFTRGAALSYCVRMVAQGSKLKSGRYYLKLSDVQKYTKP